MRRAVPDIISKEHEWISAKFGEWKFMAEPKTILGRSIKVFVKNSMAFSGYFSMAEDG